MASNDPTDTGGLFIGRRPGTRPVRFRPLPTTTRPGRRRADGALAVLLLAIELVLCVSVWGPQPMLWLWVGSQADYLTNSVSVGILVAFLGMLLTLFLTLTLARRVDHAWRLVRRAAGHRQEKGALERIFVAALIVAATAFWFWFLVLNGPGSMVWSPRAP